MPYIYNGNPAMTNIFRQVFPELVKSRGITMLEQQDMNGELFSRWKEGSNDVTIELADDIDSKDPLKEKSTINETALDAIFIGGPSTLTACLLYQLRYPNHRVQHFYASRWDSNYDGSAYYYHQRDAAPVYVNRVNRGPYCIYIDLYKRLISMEALANQAETDRHHVKISLNWTNLKMRYIFTIFIPNFWHMLNDIWIKTKRKTKIAHVIEHACRSVPIVHAISKHTGAPVETMLIHGNKKANYVGLTGSTKNPKEHFAWLNQYAYIPFHEISCEGFGAEVNQVLNFPNDGLIAPMIIENLQKYIADQLKRSHLIQSENTSRAGAQLTKLFVEPVVNNCTKDVRVTSVEWKDMLSGVTHRTKTKRVFVSLGPSGHMNIVAPKLTWTQHALDLIGRNSSSKSITVKGGYQPTLGSFWRHTVNSITGRFFRGSQCLKDFMLASGSSSIMLLAVDLNQAQVAQLDVFSRFIDGVNQHWTLIAQRDVTLPLSSDLNSPNRSYRFFAIQMTGGGNFPSRLVRPDFLLNLLYTTEKMYGIDSIDHAMYDLIQSKGCGRSVSGQNTIAFQTLCSNGVVSFALGGIGMTTMFANGEKMVEMIENQDETLRKEIKNSAWSTKFLNGIDYSFMTGETRHIERFLGFDDSMNQKEKKILISTSIATFIGFLLSTRLFF
jgi:hypothetical protein